MADLSAVDALVERWLQPLADESSPCGPDLEYDNDFLTLNQAAAGKPETQFGPGEPPDWRSVRQQAEGLADRTRDLRVVILWLRSCLHLEGALWLAPGLRLIKRMLEEQWEHIHPLPDPDDGDPYARVNALTLLREVDGVVGDFRKAYVIHDRAIGDLTVRMVELAAGLSAATGNETEVPRELASRMLGAAADRDAGLRAQVADCAKAVRDLIAVQNDRLGLGVAPDLRPLYNLANALSTLMPAAADAPDADDGGSSGDASAGDAVGVRGGGGGRGLSGAVNSREEALRAIDMVCDYLERAEPTNPAQLFLRRARVLVGANFLQLVKELAPEALADVARIVGVDPDTVEAPERP